MKKLISLGLALSMGLSLGAAALAAPNSMENFKPSAAYHGEFKDVPAASWYAAPVKTCYEYGLMKGAGPEKFNPNGTMTVAEAIVMADRVHALYTTGESTLKNGKVWYQPYVDYALENGIISADEGWSYTAKVTRAEMAHIFYRALPAAEFPAINHIGDGVLPDVNSGMPWGDEILALYNAGVLTGGDAFGTYSPDANISRSAAAAIIARVAIDDQRQQFTPLVKKPLEHALTLALPMDYKTETQDGASRYVSGSLNAIVGSMENAMLPGASLPEALPAKDWNQAVTETFAMTNGLTLEKTETTEVTFGKLRAYRTTAAFTQEGRGTSQMVLYAWADGSTVRLTLLLDSGSQNSKMLKDMANGLTLNGNVVSPKL